MERERLTQLLEGPGRVAREDLAGLTALIERYPWFSGAHVLLAEGEHRAGELLYDAHLRSAAAHVPSRALLFDRTEGLLSDPVQATLPMIEVPPAVVAHAPPSAPPGPAPAPDRKPTDAEMAERILEQQMLEAVISAGYTVQAMAEPDEVTVPVQIGPEPEISLAVEPPRTIAPVAEPKRTLEPLTGRRFTEWLSTEVVVTEMEALALPTYQEPATGPTHAPTAEGTRRTIDRFLKTQAPTVNKKTEFYTPQQAAKRSLEDGAGLISETLARIYAQQGNLTKAAEAYRKLALKYPEKSAYFAALSAEMEERQRKEGKP
jgi:hypothetical protein